MQHNCLKLVVRKVTPVDYEVETPHGHGIKVYHVNLMKKWHFPPVRVKGHFLALCPNTDNENAEENTPRTRPVGGG